ncbi:MAG: Gfo/Idh/MocA family oxidoreductase [Candidatus Hydrogenedentes bacterium]|nr:Gfo/Idh/MocA family oxidoreductase [Candidatus Hydrogenedentota bacterium]
MTRKIRVGFIGAGGIAPGHYQRLMATGRAEIAALADPSADSLARFRARCPGSETIATYSTYEQMLAAVDLDAVLVLSPHAYHGEQISVSLRRGLHVLTEKPFVCDRHEARSLIDLARETGKVLSLSYQRHYDPVFRYMRSAIAEGQLGEIQFVQSIQAQEWLRLTEGTWRQVRALSCGGQLNDSGSHVIDIILWVTGLRVAAVSARGENFGREVDVNSAITLNFENGALGNISIIGNAPAWHEDHTIIGSKGAFYLRQDGALVQQDAQGLPVSYTLPDYAENPDSNFIACILGEATTESPPECGLETIRVTEAIWTAMESGGAVRLVEN